LRRVVELLCIGILLYGMSGCASMATRAYYGDPEYYSGVKFDLQLTGEALVAPFDGDPESASWKFWRIPLFLIDVPFSAIFDTIFLPFDHRAKRTDHEDVDNRTPLNPS